ncbi:MAG: M20/M25/M40 family metallo-hydrolase [Longimicrobiaceae bacterium]
MAEVDLEQLRSNVETLARFETRNSMSDTLSETRGIGAARRWIHAQFESYGPRLEVRYDSYLLAPQGRITRETKIRNVMAVLPGRSNRRIYVSGHYDTVARRPPGWAEDDFDNPAPGANDDASGTSIVMEMARVLSQSGLEFDATLVFIAFAGEEQGLLGARLHADRIAGEGLRVDAVFNNDIVGNSMGGNGVAEANRVQVFSEGPTDSESRRIARYLRQQAAIYVPGHTVTLVARDDRFGRGGDHSAFNMAGYPGVRLTEARENYAQQHTADDLPEHMDWAYLQRNARVNAAAVASLALAPRAPRIENEGRPLLSREPSGYDATLGWEPVPGAAGYRVYWRQAWHRDWDQWVDLPSDQHSFTLDGVSIDGHVFGVAALEPEGNPSLVSVYIRPVRERDPLEVIGGR